MGPSLSLASLPIRPCLIQDILRVEVEPQPRNMSQFGLWKDE